MNNLKFWDTINYNSDYAVDVIDAVLDGQNFQDIKIVDTREGKAKEDWGLNYHGEWCPLGITRITARAFGYKGISLILTIKNSGEEEPCKIIIEKDAFNVLQFNHEVCLN